MAHLDERRCPIQPRRLDDLTQGTKHEHNTEIQGETVMLRIFQDVAELTSLAALLVLIAAIA